ncbi:major capsid protein [Frateuria edaphi]|jgi:hypothetical protein|uniref:major capsid protein n=1 Tax=Frateuria edaphi TaxID=2898793 RepID=UPI001E458F4A|nr:major capsid protein [Frateuria edaphi]UGB47230.1 major capsid protein [Frateuria edaphi]
MRKFNNSKPVAYGIGLGAFLAAASSQAAAIDVTSLTTNMTDAGIAVGTLMLAILAVLYGKKAYQWLKPN